MTKKSSRGSPRSALGGLDIRAEIKRCGLDPVYFITKYVRIKHPVRGLIPFKMFSYQADLVRSYVEARFNVVLKARQLGISEVTAAYAAWLMLFRREKNVLVIASKAETAKNIIRKIETSIKKLPSWLLLADIVVDNRLSIELSNGSRAKAIATSDDAGRSEAVSFLIIDEAAFVPRLDELWAGLYSTVAAGGSIAVLSTPNGVGNKFHSIYTDGEQQLNEFVTHRFMWWLHPERQEGLRDDPDRPGFKTSPWFENETRAANMSPRDIASEYECNFNASGDTVITSTVLQRIGGNLLDPIERRNWDRNLWIWSPPVPGTRYLISADVARGDGKDFSATHVWDAREMVQVAEYCGRIPTEDFAKLLCDLGREYNQAMLIVENNSVGLACIEHIRLASYTNVYYSRRGDTKPGDAVNTAWGVIDEDLVPGFTMSPKVRPLLVDKFEEYIRNRLVMFRSRRMHEELKTFIWNSGRAEAARGFNDDLTMAAAIGIWIRETFLTSSLASAAVNSQLLGGISLQKTSNADIPGASKDPQMSRRGMVIDRKRQLEAQLGRPGEPNDFSWLIRSG